MSDNPITYLTKKAGMSLRQFEFEYNFSHEAVMQAVAGAFESSPPRIRQAIHHLMMEKGLDEGILLDEEYGVDTFEQAYEQWRLEERARMADPVKKIRPDQLAWDRNRTPAMSFVIEASGTMTRFAKEMKIPLRTVRRWAHGDTDRLPKSVETALRDVGYPYIRELLEVQALWVENWG